MTSPRCPACDDSSMNEFDRDRWHHEHIAALKAQVAMAFEAANEAMSERVKEREKLEARVKELEARVCEHCQEQPPEVCERCYASQGYDLELYKARVEAAEKKNQEIRDIAEGYYLAVEDLKTKLAEERKNCPASDWHELQARRSQES